MIKILRHKKYKTNTTGLSTLFCSALLVGSSFMLSSCNTLFGPSAMPTGYAHHNTEYKAPPGKKPILKTWEEWTDANQPLMQTSVPPGTVVAGSPAMPMHSGMMAPMGTVNPELWQNASRDLISRLDQTYGRPMVPVFVSSTGGQVGFSAMKPGIASPEFENALKSAMFDQGWATAVAPAPNVISMTYDINPLGDGRSVLSLVLSGNAMRPLDISGIYNVMPPAAFNNASPMAGQGMMPYGQNSAMAAPSRYGAPPAGMSPYGRPQQPMAYGNQPMGTGTGPASRPPILLQ